MITRKAKSRAKLICDLKTQGQIIRMASLHWAIFCVTSVALATLVQFCSNPFEGVYANVVAGLRAFAPAILVAICLCPVFVYDFLKLSNRIFGPIPRVRNMIRTMRAGEHVEPLQAREDDVHADLVADINGLIKLLGESRAAVSTDDGNVVAQPAPADAANDTTTRAEV